MTKLDGQQRRLLELLSRSTWRSTGYVFKRTSLHRSVQSLGRSLGFLSALGYVERRPAGDRSEWRLTDKPFK